MAQAGGAGPGPVGPSRRMMAWKWTTPRRWYSATLANETRSCAARALLVGPAGGRETAQGDGEAPPQFGGAGVEQDRAG